MWKTNHLCSIFHMFSKRNNNNKYNIFIKRFGLAIRTNKSDIWKVFLYFLCLFVVVAGSQMFWQPTWFICSRWRREKHIKLIHVQPQQHATAASECQWCSMILGHRPNLNKDYNRVWQHLFYHPHTYHLLHFNVTYVLSASPIFHTSPIYMFFA